MGHQPVLTVRIFSSRRSERVAATLPRWMRRPMWIMTKCNRHVNGYSSRYARTGRRSGATPCARPDPPASSGGRRAARPGGRATFVDTVTFAAPSRRHSRIRRCRVVVHVRGGGYRHRSAAAGFLAGASRPRPVWRRWWQVARTAARVPRPRTVARLPAAAVAGRPAVAGCTPRGTGE